MGGKTTILRGHVWFHGVGAATKMKKGPVVKRVGFREEENEAHLTVFSCHLVTENPA